MSREICRPLPGKEKSLLTTGKRLLFSGLYVGKGGVLLIGAHADEGLLQLGVASAPKSSSPVTSSPPNSRTYSA